MTLTKSRTESTGLQCAAVFSDDEAYRYDLTWRWGRAPLLVGWMLNPSIATHEVLDNTVSGLVTRAKNWGMGGVRVVNLFAFREKDRKVMLRHPDPIGPDNDRIVADVITEAKKDQSIIVAAWGADGRHLDRQDAALAIARTCGVPLHALAINKNGTPKHPLYVDHRIRPILWHPSRS